MKEDTRRLSPSAQEEKRKFAIKLWNKGLFQKEVAEKVGTTPQTMSGWVKRYKNSGPSSLNAQKRGAAFGDNRHLSADQEKHLQK